MVKIAEIQDNRIKSEYGRHSIFKLVRQYLSCIANACLTACFKQAFLLSITFEPNDI
ncbi:hypothetical protein HMPREF9370_1768 [Neisseria wadsworthii 9715]|uniref:Uncharacterized protein n=1 Tax=Neisseria wadsworthii 9715 TaxID=1030841 RepID=G4CRQ8_9NEIS|nr:hypothetical protein HMPREF9370_1768 [Neisseria wadsworthii 9715]